MWFTDILHDCCTGICTGGREITLKGMGKMDQCRGNINDTTKHGTTVGKRTVALKIIARCSITQTPTGQWNIDNFAV